MTRFDADIPLDRSTDRPASSVRAILASGFGTLVLFILLAGLAIAVAMGVLLAAQGAQVKLARTIDAFQMSVFLQPQVARSDAESLRGRIEAIPAVAGARLRTREDAVATLVGDGLSALTTRVNPLPDVWIVSLRGASPGVELSRLSARVADTRAALEALPGVESVRVDGRWVDLLERSSSWLDRATGVATWTVSIALLAALLGLSFLTGRALPSDARGEEGRTQAFATVGMLSGLLSLAVGGALLASVTLVWPEGGSIAGSILDSVGRNGHVFLVASGLAIICTIAVGQAWGAMRR